MANTCLPARLLPTAAGLNHTPEGCSALVLLPTRNTRALCRKATHRSGEVCRSGTEPAPAEPCEVRPHDPCYV